MQGLGQLTRGNERLNSLVANLLKPGWRLMLMMALSPKVTIKWSPWSPLIQEVDWTWSTVMRRWFRENVAWPVPTGPAVADMMIDPSGPKLMTILPDESEDDDRTGLRASCCYCGQVG